MDKNDLDILNVFIEIIPKLSKQDKEKLLAFGEGLCFSIGICPPGKNTKSKSA